MGQQWGLQVQPLKRNVSHSRRRVRQWWNSNQPTMEGLMKEGIQWWATWGDICLALDEHWRYFLMVFEHSFLFAERRMRRTLCDVDNSCGWAINDTVVDLGNLGVSNNGCCIHQWELVEWGKLMVTPNARGGAGRTQRWGRAIWR